MSRRRANRDEQRLGDRLRREALESRPAFSEELHARMVRAVRQSEVFDAPKRRRPSFPDAWWSLRPVRIAAACACVLAAAIVGWRLTGRGIEPGGPHSPAPPEWVAPMAVDGGTDEVTGGLLAISELADRVAGQLDKMLDSQVVSEDVAYLDEDARLAVRGLIAQLPVDLGSVDRLSPEKQAAD
jgi:hypothetical protein